MAKQTSDGLLVGGLVLLSLQAISMLWVLDQPAISSNPVAVFGAGIVCLLGVACAAKLLCERSGCKFSPSAIFFALTTWSALVDLTLALSIVGITTLGRFYVITGEEYFKR